MCRVAHLAALNFRHPLLHRAKSENPSMIVPGMDPACRAVASMYSWGGGGGVGQKFPNPNKISEYFMAYEDMKVFANRKMKMQFTNKNTHSLGKDILQKHAVP